MREATARMVATLRIRQLQKDVKDAEEAELQLYAASRTVRWQVATAT